MGDERLWDVIEKHGVVLRAVVCPFGKSFYDAVLEVLNDTNNTTQVMKSPPTDCIRVSIILEPIPYDEGE